MSISAELEKLASLRDRGDLSEEEFEKAKALLLSENEPSAPISDLADNESLEELKKKTKTQFLCAVFSTLAAALSGCSVLLNPSALKLIIMIIWVVASVLWWISHTRMKAELKKLEQPVARG